MLRRRGSTGCGGAGRWWRGAVAIATLLMAGVAGAASEAPRRNVLFIVCDDLCCALGSYGDATAATPHIDALAARGVRFERAYCQYPLCNPSRASLLTGRRPSHTEVHDNARRFRDVDPTVVTLPQAFRNAGWRTERIGKLYHYGVPKEIGTDGLDDPESWDDVFNPKGRDVADEDQIFSLRPGEFGGTVSWLAADGTDAEQTDGIAAARAVERLEAFARDKTPFFLAVGFYRPHTPYVAPKAWFAKHPLAGVQLPVVPADHDTGVPAEAFGSHKPEQQRLAGDLGREALQAYRASVSFVDAQAGLVLDALRRLGLEENTVVVVTSDHGYHLGEHGLWQKSSLFEESARVPLVIAAPDGRPGAVADHTVELIDLLPTVCDLAGVSVPPGVDGRSLAPLVCGSEELRNVFPERPAFTEVGKPGDRRRGMSVRSGRWRYTVWKDGGRQLYDHETDPRELVNLADDPACAATVRELDGLVRGQAAAARPPNVLVILADDLGFSDLGCYGGEIDTPHLDRLAAGGARFTQGYNTARCWPTRAALLTGYYPQAIGRDALPGGKGGAQGKRPAWAPLLPERLAAAGYRSYHSGKWHIDGDPRTQGFARSLDVGRTGQNDYFAPEGTSEDGAPLAADGNFYATTAIGDHAVRCLADHAREHAGTPFFHYVAFTAPHFPLQAPADLVAKYRDRYRVGWDAIRAARCRRLRESGIVTAPPAEPEPDVGPPYQPPPETLARLGPGEVDRPRPWESLTDEQREFQATKMAIHAAMVESMDREVGRIVAQLVALGELENTFLLFLSDNGASAEIMMRGAGHDPEAPPGSRQTFLCLGPGWSTAANAPFRRHKTWVHEGGIATPWIVHWPAGVSARGELRSQPVHVIDLVPTVLEIARAPEQQGGQAWPPLHGRSFAATLTNASARPAHESLWWCHEGNRAVREGDWKLVATAGEDWELYDLAADRCETADLAAAHPDQVAALARAWSRIAEKCRGMAPVEVTRGPGEAARP